MTYDLIVVFHPTLEPEKAESKLKQAVTGEGLEIVTSESWGVKDLAYPINKQAKGLFWAMTLNGSIASEKMYARFKLDDTVMRSLFIKKIAAKHKRIKKTKAKTV